jgi:hypothetical protein
MRPQRKTPTLWRENTSPGGRDPHPADIDQPAAGPDLLVRQGRKSSLD